MSTRRRESARDYKLPVVPSEFLASASSSHIHLHFDFHANRSALLMKADPKTERERVYYEELKWTEDPHVSQPSRRLGHDVSNDNVA